MGSASMRAARRPSASTGFNPEGLGRAGAAPFPGGPPRCRPLKGQGAAARGFVFRLSGLPSCRIAVPVATTGLVHHAYGQAVAHRGFDLATRDADVAKHTIVEPLELAYSATQALLRGQAARPARAAKNENSGAQFCVWDIVRLLRGRTRKSARSAVSGSRSKLLDATDLRRSGQHMAGCLAAAAVRGLKELWGFSGDFRINGTRGQKSRHRGGRGCHRLPTTPFRLSAARFSARAGSPAGSG